MTAFVPTLPNTQGPGSVNTSFFFTKYVMEGKEKAADLKRDPREALLAMEEKVWQLNL